MKSQGLLVGSLMSAYGLLTPAFAGTTAAQSPNPVKQFQYYAGLSGGVNHMSAKQNQSVSYPAGEEVVSFLNNVTTSNNEGHYFAFGGVTWNIPATSFFLEPEIYAGRTSNTVEKRVSIMDIGNGTPRTMQTTLRQSNFIGASFHAGANLPWQSRAYAILGFESSQFRYATFYIPRSRNVLSGGVQPDLDPSYFTAKKWLNGFMWGLGIEKTYNCFRFGGDIRFVHYQQLKVSYPTDSADGNNNLETINNSFKPKNIRFSLRLSYIF